MKRKLSLFLTLIMLLGILPVNVFAATDATKLASKNDKNYEEVTIDKVPYKVYKLADLMDKPAKKSPVASRFMSMFVSPLGNPVPTGTNDIKFVLDLSWETFDRPIENVTMPVWVGPPEKEGSIKLGYFVVDSKASPGAKQSFEMTQELSLIHI